MNHLKKQLLIIKVLKPGLHIVVMIADHACDVVSKRILKLSTHRLQILLVKYDNCYHYQAKVYVKTFATVCLRSLRLIWRPDFISSNDCSSRIGL